MNNRISYPPLSRGPFPTAPKILEFWVGEHGVGAIVEGNRDYSGSHYESSFEDFTKWVTWVDVRSVEVKGIWLR